MTWPTVTAAIVPIAGPVTTVSGTEPELLARILGDGSMAETIHISHTATGFVDEEGFIKQLPRNARASLIFEALFGPPPAGGIVGPMIVFGNVDDEGCSTSISNADLGRLQRLPEVIY